jgi:sterol desaturase/sphingolipid hydroxylase (fatty acid hydroxylase superfamily)
MLDYLQTLDWPEAAGLFLLENLLVMGVALLFGHGLRRVFTTSSAPALPNPITRKEWQVALLTLLINSLITLAGFLLWRRGIITLHTGFSFRILVVFVVLFLGMDLLMYLFHYLVHKTFLYGLIHRLHHQYREPQPIALFVLHPVETLGFGSLWLGLMIVYPANINAVVIYLSLNVLFGVLGHSGIEPFPASWQKQPLLKYIGSATFHYQHHQHEGYNFGFYTSIWDRLFGTLAPPAVPQDVPSIR